MKTATNPMTDTIIVRGATLEYTCWPGSSANRLPILLLHEGLGSIALWRTFPQLLAKATGRDVIAWSRQGHGWSDPIKVARSPDYMHKEARLLPEVYDQLKITRAHLLGHSDGGSIALMTAAWFPELVASITLEAPHVFVEDVTIENIAKVGETYDASDMGDRMRRYHADPDHIFRMWNDIWLDPEFREWNIESILSRVSLPALLIQGKDDEYGSMEQLDRIEALLDSTVRLELDACGHSPHREQQDTVLQAVSLFLKGRG